ncbi:MAG: quinone-dependent dihydroorotate dehydrogenase [Hyphomonadaceae bacterium]|nr:quinone-dependent dihydroorotate dehydrogenase [Hyphomonadaceae bacterium]
MAIADLAARLVRCLPPEAAHRVTVAALKSGLGVPARRPEMLPGRAVKLPVSGLSLPNPIGLAAGFDKNAEAFAAMLGFGFGFVECGTVTPKPQPGNPKPRLFRLTEDRAVINRMGFNNEGLDGFVDRLSAREPGAGIVGANVGANKTTEDFVADYVTGMQAVWRYADYITLNISSPNTPGLRDLQGKSALEDLLGRCGEAGRRLADEHGFLPIFLKVAPDLDDVQIADIATAAKAAPYLHGLIVSNTTLARPITLRSAFKSEGGGLSGAPLMAPSTEVLAAFKTEVGDSLDLIGAGGVADVDDVWAKLAAGAQAVQLYSALVYEGPGLIRRILAEL